MGVTARKRLLAAAFSLLLLGGCGGGGGGDDNAPDNGDDSIDDPVDPGPVDPSKTQSFTYDALGRLSVVTYDDGTTITYSYDASGNIVGRAVAGVVQ